MTIPVRYPLPVNRAYDSGAHGNDVFKNDFRSKAAAEAYFNAFGAGTLTFVGTEGTDYEFHATNGFRTKTNLGGAKILMNNILASDALTYWITGGMTLDFQVLTSEWIEPAPAPTTAYLNPVTDMNGAAAGALSGTYLINFGSNNGLGYAAVQALDDVAANKTKGRNRLHFRLSPNATDPNCCSRPCTRFNKSDFLSCRLTLMNNTGAAWIDQTPAIPAHAATDTAFVGPHFGRASTASMALPTQTTGNAVIWIGQYGSNAAACTRWIRNLRMYNTVTDYSYHPWLARVLSFGDSYSATLLGPAAVGAANQNLGQAGDPGENTTASANGYAFCDVVAILRYHQLLLQNGYNVGGMYGSGQGGHYFSAGSTASLIDLGYKDRLLKNLKPTLCFTFGLHNDVAQVANGNTTVAALKTLLLGTYLKPAMDAGCRGWGFVIPAMDQAGIATSASFDAVAAMMLELPAAFDAAYPAYAGRVKVSDARTEMGMDWTNNKNWVLYYSSTDNVHPTSYGGNIAAVRFAQMTLEWLRE